MWNYNYFIYILTSKNHTVLYTGMTSDLRSRIFEHKQKHYKGFTARYNVDKLVYFERFSQADEAVTREKQIKAGSRKKKLDLINKLNPNWEDLFHTELID
jgi:putative endonuclease